MHRIATLALAAALTAGAALADTPALPFDMPVPAGWRTETIPFPLSFAPELEYRGLEELRFAPGMFKEGAEDFWSYSFVWAVEDELALDPEVLARDLIVYFDGLTAAVRKSKKLPPTEVRAESSLRRIGARLEGTASLLDAFATQERVELNVRVTRLAAPEGHAAALYFQLSPRPFTHPVWKTLAEIGAGYTVLREGA